MPRDSINRAELDQLFAEWGAAFTKAFLRILLPPGSEDAAQAAAQRDEEMRTHDPQFYDAVQAVRKARQDGAFVTEGVDVGHRHGPGLHKISAGDDDDIDRVGPASRTIARGKRERLRRARERGDV